MLTFALALIAADALIASFVYAFSVKPIPLTPNTWI